MSEPTNQEIKDLILSLDKRIDNLDRKFEIKFIELKSEIIRVEEKLSGEIIRVEEKLSGEIKRVEEKLSGDIKRVEEKLEAKIDGLDKRLSNEEFISRSAFTALVIASLTGLIKFLFFDHV